MTFNWVKSIFTNTGFYALFIIIFYLLFNKYKSKTETTANAYIFIYSLLVNIITLGIVAILSNPNINENTWSFVLFSAPAVLGIPLSLFGLSLVPLLLICLIPFVFIFHALRMDVYIGAIGVSFALTMLATGCVQYYMLGWGVKHGFKALKEKMKEKGKILLAVSLIVILVSLLGVFSWSKMREVLQPLYLDKRQEIKYW